MATFSVSPAALRSAAAGLAGSPLHKHGPRTSTVTPAAVAPAPALVRCDSTSQETAVQSEARAAAASRRTVLSALAGLALVAGAPSPAVAAYGEAANVFGAYRGRTDFAPYTGAGFSLDLPAKWNPSREVGEYPNVVLRYEDNFDATSNLVVIAQPTTLATVADLGSPTQFLEKFSYLLGLQSFEGETASEGGFEKNTTLTAAVLDEAVEEKGGKTYYRLNVLTRTADGDEGGKHQLFSAAVSDGKLFILKVQAGDKRWFKGARKYVEGAAASFSVA